MMQPILLDTYFPDAVVVNTSFLEGGFRIPQPMKIQFVDDLGVETGPFVFRTLGASKDQALYVVQLTLQLLKAGIPVPPIILPKCHRDNPTPLFENYLLGFKDSSGKEVFGVLQEFLVEGDFLDRDIAYNAERKRATDYLIAYETIGKLAGNIQNAVQDFKPHNIHRYSSRKAIASKILCQKDAYLEQLKKSTEQNDPKNDSEIFFLENVDTIREALEVQLGAFLKNWDDQLPSSHIHNDLHFGNVLMNDSYEVTGLIDFGQAQVDPRVVEFSNMVMAVYPPDDPLGNARSYFDVETLSKVFVALVTGFNKVAVQPYTSAEIQCAWEVLRLRLAEMMFGNRLGAGRAFPNPLQRNHVISLKCCFIALRDFPLVAPLK